MEFMKLPNEYVTMLEEHCEKLQEVGQKFGWMNHLLSSLLHSVLPDQRLKGCE
jgi:hypothetical protein